MVMITKRGTRVTDFPPYTLDFVCPGCGCEFRLEEGDNDFTTEHVEPVNAFAFGHTVYTYPCPMRDCTATGQAVDRPHR